jgi:hypothetical protein
MPPLTDEMHTSWQKMTSLYMAGKLLVIFLLNWQCHCTSLTGTELHHADAERGSGITILKNVS